MRQHTSPRPIGVGVLEGSARRGWARIAHVPALQALQEFVERPEVDLLGEFDGLSAVGRHRTLDAFRTSSATGVRERF